MRSFARFKSSGPARATNEWQCKSDRRPGWFGRVCGTSPWRKLLHRTPATSSLRGFWFVRHPPPLAIAPLGRHLVTPYPFSPSSPPLHSYPISSALQHPHSRVSGSFQSSVAVWLRFRSFPAARGNSISIDSFRRVISSLSPSRLEPFDLDYRAFAPRAHH